MTEREYIDVCDLEKVNIANSILSCICVANQPTIPEDEYLLVMRTIDKWLEALWKKPKIKGQS